MKKRILVLAVLAIMFAGFVSAGTKNTHYVCRVEVDYDIDIDFYKKSLGKGVLAKNSNAFFMETIEYDNKSDEKLTINDVRYKIFAGGSLEIYLPGWVSFKVPEETGKTRSAASFVYVGSWRFILAPDTCEIIDVIYLDEFEEAENWFNEEYKKYKGRLERAVFVQ